MFMIHLSHESVSPSVSVVLYSGRKSNKHEIKLIFTFIIKNRGTVKC